jgi:hypothetical protein
MSITISHIGKAEAIRRLYNAAYPAFTFDLYQGMGRPWYVALMAEKLPS